MALGSAPVQTKVVTPNTGTSYSLVLDSAPSNSNTLFLTMVANVTVTNSQITSITQTGVTWVKRSTHTPTFAIVELWVGTVSSGASATMVINTTGDLGGATVRSVAQEWAGTLIFERTGDNGGSASTSPTTGTISPTAGRNSLIIVAQRGGNVSAGPTGGFTAIATGSASQRTEYLVIANTSGTYSCSWTTNASNYDNVYGVFYLVPGNVSPTALISTPANGASVAAGTSVSFSGTGSDTEDGTLTGASLVWTSNIDGTIGTGTSFSKSNLSVGTHTITLTATDSVGATGSATRTLTITSTTNGTWYTRSYLYNGTTYDYKVFVPGVAAPSGGYPLITQFGGSVELGNDNVSQTQVGLGPVINASPASWKYITIFPQFPSVSGGTTVRAGMCETMIPAIIASAVSEFNGNANKSYLFGLSLGGSMGWGMCWKLPTQFAAFVPAPGVMQLNIFQAHGSAATTTAQCAAACASALGSLPIWQFEGDADTTYTPTMAHEIRDAMLPSSNYSYTEYAGVDHANTWITAFNSPALYTWLDSKQKAPPGNTVALPQVTPARVLTSGLSYASTTTVTAATLQSTIDAKAALSGSGNHLIIVQDGEIITSSVFLRRRSAGGTGYIVIRSQTLPCAEGIQVHPSMLTTQAEFRFSGAASASAISTEQGVAGVDYYILDGLYINQVANSNTTLCGLGDGSATQNTVALVPKNIGVTRCVIRGANTRRAIALHSGYTWITECWLSGAYLGSDAQAIGGANGTGPYLIEHNYLEGSGENIMFGGQSVAIPGMVPADITVRLNAFNKPLTWYGNAKSVKNLFELKIGIRVLIEGNTFENGWADEQVGIAVLIKAVDQNFLSPWLTTTDVTFRYNFVRNMGGFLNLSADPEGGATDMKRVRVHDNVAVNIGTDGMGGDARSYQLAGTTEGTDYAVDHNTVVLKDTSPQAATAWLYGPLVNCKITDNIDARPQDGSYGVRADGLAAGSATWNAVSSGASELTRNVLGGHNGSEVYPAGNFLVGASSSIGFVNVGILPTLHNASPDSICAALTLAAGSPYKGVGAGGTDPGANMATVRAFIAKTWVPGLVSDGLGAFTGPGPNALSGGGTPAATSLGMVTQPSSTAASGAVLAVQPAVEIRDQFGARKSDDVSTVTAALIAVTGSGTAIGTLTKAAVSGVATFTGLGVTSAAGGTFKWRFTDGALTSVDSAVFTVSGAPVLTSIEVTVQPGNGTSGTALAVQPEVRFRDQFGQLFSTTLTVTAAVSAGTASITAGGTKAAVGGVALFSGLTLTATSPQTVTLTFSASGVPTVSANALTLSVVLTATKLGIQAQPAGIITGQVFSQQPTVLVQDASSRTVTTSSAAVAVAVTSGTAVLSGTTSVNAVSGVATFPNLKLTGSGTVVLTFTSAGLTSAVSQTLTVSPVPTGNRRNLPKQIASRSGQKAGKTLDALWNLP